jgi:hypothetical protein
MYEDLPNESSTCVSPATSEGPVVRILHEMDALNAALRVVESGGDVDEARLLGRTFLARLDPETVEQRVIEASLQLILKEPVDNAIVDGAPPRNPWEEHVAAAVATSWLAWAAGDKPRAQAQIKRLRAKRKTTVEAFKGRTGAIHLLTLYFWSQAVSELLLEDRRSARRFFKRAIELGGQFGTNSHPMISWAYAASFFEDGVEPAADVITSR